MKAIRAWGAAAAIALIGLGVSAAAQDAKVERGKYLVEEVARCQECHTPRTADNGFDRSQWLKGATLVGVPATPPADWHQKTPDISSTSALWQRWGDAGFATFLETAKNTRGGKAGPPMPPYMMKAEEAEAIVAYLKTVK